MEIIENTNDETETMRRRLIAEYQKNIASQDAEEERKRLSERYGNVWNTDELARDFEVQAFLAPFVSVIRKSDRVKGTLEFQDRPRFYFCFRPY